jgi:hypothetical protein
VPADLEYGSPLFLDMTEEVLVLHDPDGIRRGYLGKPQERLRAFGARRIPEDGGYYLLLELDLEPCEDSTPLTESEKAERAWSRVVRQAQQLVELVLKAMLREVGVDPPERHDIGPILTENAQRFFEAVRAQLPRPARIFQWLRKEREFSFGEATCTSSPPSNTPRTTPTAPSPTPATPSRPQGT